MRKYAIIGVIILIAIGGYWIWSNEPDLIPGNQTASPSPTSSPKGGASGGSPSGQASGGSVSSLTYDQALKEYAGRIIQFDALCQAIPSSMVVKNGISLMFDNRSGDGRWIALDGVGYFIKGYGFRILSITSKTLPHTMTLDCGSAKNVGKINIQK